VTTETRPMRFEINRLKNLRRLSTVVTANVRSLT
jgi:hypothetical protein